MKLLFCPDCQDILRLHSGGPYSCQECLCKKTAGYQYDDRIARHNGHGFVIWLHAGQFLHAVQKIKDDPALGLEHLFTAAVIPSECKAIQIVPEWRFQGEPSPIES